VTGQQPSNSVPTAPKSAATMNHGVDCDMPEGLKEWLLQERSRPEAVRDGSRHPAAGSAQTGAVAALTSNPGHRHAGARSAIFQAEVPSSRCQ